MKPSGFQVPIWCLHTLLTLCIQQPYSKWLWLIAKHQTHSSLRININENIQNIYHCLSKKTQHYFESKHQHLSPKGPVLKPTTLCTVMSVTLIITQKMTFFYNLFYGSHLSENCFNFPHYQVYGLAPWDRFLTWSAWSPSVAMAGMQGIHNCERSFPIFSPLISNGNLVFPYILKARNRLLYYYQYLWCHQFKSQLFFMWQHSCSRNPERTFMYIITLKSW